nr:RNA-directed DNA polymerase, eukaryota [Tanacetum cinerariifolium]
FWLDTWTLDSPLYVRFPRLFALESIKDISVAVKWCAPSFDASFRRRARNGAESEFRVKDIRSSIDDTFLPSSDSATRWVKTVPIKVNILAWRTRLDRLPTRVKVYLKEFVVGRIFSEWRSRRMLNGIAGLSLSVCWLSSNSCWRVFFIHVGGISGPSGTVLSLILLRLEEL